MATIEQVERLRERANVSYEDAKEALDATGGDMLEAMIYLERQGKVEAPANGGSFTSVQMVEERRYEKQEKTADDGESFSSLAGKFFGWCGRVISKGNEYMFEVWRKEKITISVPVTVLVLLMLFAFWVVIPLIVLGLFFGCRYIFRGPGVDKTGVNNVMNSAAEAAESIKREINDRKHE